MKRGGPLCVFKSNKSLPWLTKNTKAETTKNEVLFIKATQIKKKGKQEASMVIEDDEEPPTALNTEHSVSRMTVELQKGSVPRAMTLAEALQERMLLM